jgi:bifunctional non-homologous end joining protein LigD
MPRESKRPKQLQPMLATLIDAPFDSPDWVFETKWDGFRLVARIEKRSLTLYSRNGLIVSDNYKPIAKALEKVKRDAVIDGELVAFDAHGVSRFQLLQNALRTVTNRITAPSTSCLRMARTCARFPSSSARRA